MGQLRRVISQAGDLLKETKGAFSRVRELEERNEWAFESRDNNISS